MSGQTVHETPQGSGPKRRESFSPEFLRITTIVSVIPAYLAGGALIGYVCDRLFGTFPFLIAAGLLGGLILGVRDLLRLRDEFKVKGGHGDDEPD